MTPLLSYIGPGLGMATIVIVLLVLFIVITSMVMIAWTSGHYVLRRIGQLFRGAARK